MRKVLSSKGFAAQLLGAQALVLAVTVGTAALVAWLVGPAIFHDHLAQAGHALDAQGVAHVERAYTDSNTLSLGIAFAVALGLAALLSWGLAARVRAPVDALGAASARMARGDYAARVEASGTATEFADLARSFNNLASRLEHVEDTRRGLLTDLAHELRTPIATLAGYLDGVDDGVVAWTGQTRTVLHDQVRRLSRLASDIEAVSRAEEGRISLCAEPVSVGALVDTAVAAAQDEFARRSVELVTDDGAAARAAYPVVVHADPQRLGQVLANLLSNAVRHTPDGGRVTCSASLVTGRAHAADGVRLTVTDTGSGIAAEHLPHVFERFYRADRARHREAAADQGAGVGLTISRAIVEAHGGTLEVASDGDGHGATFTITLPVPRRPETPSSPDAAGIVPRRQP